MSLNKDVDILVNVSSNKNFYFFLNVESFVKYFWLDGLPDLDVLLRQKYKRLLRRSEKCSLSLR